MQGWHNGKGLIYFMANISANKVSLPQGQGYTKGKYYNGSLNLNFKRYTSGFKNDKLIKKNNNNKV